MSCPCCAGIGKAMEHGVSHTRLLDQLLQEILDLEGLAMTDFASRIEATKKAIEIIRYI
jgi:hypothetical protein